VLETRPAAGYATLTITAFDLLARVLQGVAMGVLSLVNELRKMFGLGEIDYDPDGIYPTQVHVKVSAVKKGRVEGGHLVVALLSGPRRNPKLGRIAESRVPYEPSFRQGEAVLLFLTKRSTDAPASDLPATFYRLVNLSKFHLSGGVASLEGWGSAEFHVGTIADQVERVAAAQVAGCR